MNLILFERFELESPLPPDDRRARHLREVLRRREGESFDCGMVDGPRGRARIVQNGPEGLELEFDWGTPPPALDPVGLLVGLPRPQTARKILGEITALGVARIDFFRAERGEASYASSTLWTSGEVRRHLIAGAEQAFCTRLPEVRVHAGLGAALESMPPGGWRVALDNYEAAEPLSTVAGTDLPAVAAVGPERGWSPDERARLREAGYALAHLGHRVLRTETACVAAVVLLRVRLGLI